MKKLFQLSFCALTLCGPTLFAKENIDDLLEGARKKYNQEKYSEAYQDLYLASVHAFEKMPLSLENFVLIEEPSEGYGIYKERTFDTYKAGEPIYIYCEPKGYTFNEQNDIYNFGLTTDFYVTDEEGNNLGGQEKFGVFNFDSHQPSTEFMLNLTYSLSGLKSGTYTIHTIATDANSDKKAEKTMDIQIEDEDETESNSKTSL